MHSEHAHIERKEIWSWDFACWTFSFSFLFSFSFSWHGKGLQLWNEHWPVCVVSFSLSFSRHQSIRSDQIRSNHTVNTRNKSHSFLDHRRSNLCTRSPHHPWLTVIFTLKTHNTLKKFWIKIWILSRGKETAIMEQDNQKSLDELRAELEELKAIVSVSRVFLLRFICLLVDFLTEIWNLINFLIRVNCGINLKRDIIEWLQLIKQWI